MLRLQKVWYQDVLQSLWLGISGNDPGSLHRYFTLLSVLISNSGTRRKETFSYSIILTWRTVDSDIAARKCNILYRVLDGVGDQHFLTLTRFPFGKCQVMWDVERYIQPANREFSLVYFFICGIGAVCSSHDSLVGGNLYNMVLITGPIPECDVELKDWYECRWRRWVDPCLYTCSGPQPRQSDVSWH